MQKVVGVTSCMIQHVLSDSQHVAVQRATVNFLRMNRVHAEERDTRPKDYIEKQFITSFCAHHSPLSGLNLVVT
jgi:hypothetical protein